MDGVTVGEGVFAAFVSLIVGVTHPAARTHPTIMKNRRKLNFFIGNPPFSLGDDPFLIVISIPSVKIESC